MMDEVRKALHRLLDDLFEAGMSLQRDEATGDVDIETEQDAELARRIARTGNPTDHGG